jgi:hypothetical protein
MTEQNSLSFLSNPQLMSHSSNFTPDNNSGNRVVFGGDLFEDSLNTWISKWGETSASTLGPWSLNDSFKPYLGVSFRRRSFDDASQLTVIGIKVSIILWCGDTTSLQNIVDLLIDTQSIRLFSELTLELLPRTLAA